MPRIASSLAFVLGLGLVWTLGLTGCQFASSDTSCLADLASDPGNCGTCGTTCGGDAPFCVDGQCVATCAGNTVTCDGRCVSLATDPLNCGACGNYCGPGGVCSEGSCQCGEELTDCGSYCADTTSDSANCGGCGLECPTAASHCEDSVCRCEQGYSACQGGCTDTKLDPKNCGRCGEGCDDDEACVAGQCTCRPGLVKRDGGGDCVNPDTNPSYCGPDQRDCDGDTEHCEGGSCVDECSDGKLSCEDACVDPLTDPMHCGSCEKRCHADELCVAGVCTDYEPAFGCNTCPCATCDGDSCCGYGSATVCLDGAVCP